MRLWSLHPSYLDAKGLVALWREGLLARAVLRGKTRGYVTHPQLYRFRHCASPIAAIDGYLLAVYEESLKRGYHFDSSKTVNKIKCPDIWVTDGQLRYEYAHLTKKLKSRSLVCYMKNIKTMNPLPHPIFKVRPGGIEEWERARQKENEP